MLEGKSPIKMKQIRTVLSQSNHTFVSCAVLWNIFCPIVCHGVYKCVWGQLEMTKAGKQKGILVNMNLLVNHLNEIGLDPQLSRA